MTFDDATQILRRAIRTKFGGDSSSCYIQTLTDNTVVWVCYDYYSDSGNFTRAVDYSMDTAGNVTFRGEPRDVITKTQILPAPTVNSGGGGNGAQQSASGTMASNTGTDPMSGNNSGGNAGGNASGQQAPATAVTGEALQQGTIGAGGPEAVSTTAAPAVQSAADWMRNAPPEIQKLVANAARQEAAQKDKAIQTITANAQNKFTKEQLALMDVEVLENLAVLAAPPENSDVSDTLSYLGRFSPQSNYSPVAETVGTAAAPQGQDGDGGSSNQRNNDRPVNGNGAPPAPRALMSGEDSLNGRPGSFRRH